MGDHSISEEQFWKRSLTSYGDGRAKTVCRRSFRTGQLRQFQRQERQETARRMRSRPRRGPRSRRIPTTPTEWSTTRCCTRGSWIRRSSTRTPNVRDDEPLFIQDPGSWARRPKRSPASTTCSWPASGSRPTRTSRRWRAPTRAGAARANGVLQASGYSGPMVKIVELFLAPWWAPFKAADRARYRTRLPHALDIVDHPLAVAPPVAAATVCAVAKCYASTVRAVRKSRNCRCEAGNCVGQDRGVDGGCKPRLSAERRPAVQASPNRRRHRARPRNPVGVLVCDQIAHHPHRDAHQGTPSAS